MPLPLEQDIARNLRVNLDDEIVMDVQDVPVAVRTTSPRKADWSRFNLNFFLPPGVLEEAPGPRPAGHRDARRERLRGLPYHPGRGKVTRRKPVVSKAESTCAEAST